MRRKDLQITDNKILTHILENNIICRVAYNGDDYPYITPLNYGYKDNIIYLHSGVSGKKNDLMAKNNKVCFEITDSIKLREDEMACRNTTTFRSIIGFGQIETIDDVSEKRTALNILMKQNTGKDDWEFNDKILAVTLVFKLTIDSYTGKLHKR